MPEIIVIDNLKYAVPKKNIWYKYYNDIFISAVGENNKHHIRLKNEERIKKTDIKNNKWHTDWQYQIIETKYGLSVSNSRTYEISFLHNNERHQIDSLIGNIAIEFQHTLSVSTDEMDSRFIAQRAQGYMPYLVLDYTEKKSFKERFNDSLRNVNNNPDNIDLSPFNIKVLASNDFYHSIRKDFAKWIRCEYFENNNLFIEFSDIIIRLIKRSQNMFIVFQKNTFIDKLLEFEDYSNSIIQQEIVSFEHEKQLKIEVEQKRKARIQEQSNREIERNRNRKLIDKDFNLYRICRADQIILQVFPDVESENIEYEAVPSKIENGITQKTHSYTSLDSPFELHYTTYSKIENDKYNFLYAIIVLKRLSKFEVQTFTFKKSKVISNIITRKIELYPGFLHSANYCALREYDNRTTKSDKFYLFNTLVEDENDWKNLRLYFLDVQIYAHDEDFHQQYSNLIQEIENNDFLNLRQFYFEEGHLPEWKIMELNKAKEIY
jgi:hypothetical protein